MWTRSVGGEEATNAASCGQVERGGPGCSGPKHAVRPRREPRGWKEGRSGLGSERPRAEGGTRGPAELCGVAVGPLGPGVARAGTGSRAVGSLWVLGPWCGVAESE